MSGEEIKKLCKEEFLKNIKENIKSETIFIYVDGLEKALKEADEAVEYWQKECDKRNEVLDKIKEYIKEEEYQEEGYGTLVIETKKLNELLEEIE